MRRLDIEAAPSAGVAFGQPLGGDLPDSLLNLRPGKLPGFDGGDYHSPDAIPRAASIGFLPRPACFCIPVGGCPLSLRHLMLLVRSGPLHISLISQVNLALPVRNLKRSSWILFLAYEYFRFVGRVRIGLDIRVAASAARVRQRRILRPMKLLRVPHIGIDSKSLLYGHQLHSPGGKLVYQLDHLSGASSQAREFGDDQAVPLPQDGKELPLSGVLWRSGG